MSEMEIAGVWPLRRCTTAYPYHAPGRHRRAHLPLPPSDPTPRAPRDLRLAGDLRAALGAGGVRDPAWFTSASWTGTCRRSRKRAPWWSRHSTCRPSSERPCQTCSRRPLGPTQTPVSPTSGRSTIRAARPDTNRATTRAPDLSGARPGRAGIRLEPVHHGRQVRRHDHRSGRRARVPDHDGRLAHRARHRRRSFPRSAGDPDLLEESIMATKPKIGLLVTGLLEDDYNKTGHVRPRMRRGDEPHRQAPCPLRRDCQPRLRRVRAGCRPGHRGLQWRRRRPDHRPRARLPEGHHPDAHAAAHAGADPGLEHAADPPPARGRRFRPDHGQLGHVRRARDDHRPDPHAAARSGS